MKNEQIVVKTTKRKEVIDLTNRVNGLVKEREFQTGVCNLFVTHTTCCLTTGEMGEGTAEDLLEVVQQLIPKINFRHAHNPAHAWSHMASSIIGASLSIPVEKGRLVLGLGNRFY